MLKLILWFDVFSTSCKIFIRCMLQNSFDDTWTSVQVMAWCRQATSHYLNQSWSSSMTPYSIPLKSHLAWWCHQMETSSALLALCAENSRVTGEFPSQRPVTRSFGVFNDLRLDKRLSKQPWGWWFGTPLGSLWCYCNSLASHCQATSH